ncbi:hypothetical protein N4R57_00245 [Rhodobacteraceae bacterium D3-12]|nr:hypothetical protein N4R57_00245 [Rhodobacteraceae bacterium D3-12]
MEFLVRDENGDPVDAAVEIVDSSIVLQSRGGTKGTEQAKNTDYSTALRLLLARLQQNKDLFVNGFVDSNRVQKISKVDRQVLDQTDLSRSLEEIFTVMSRRMQAVGKPPTTERHTGNANKRIRFTFSNASLTDLVQIANGDTPINASADRTDLSSVDLYWAEGDFRLVSHLRRERANGLSDAKKTAFIQEHGKLYCEKCQFDPVSTYKDEAAKACIEVHHRAVAVSKMTSGHKTRLSDLQCLCANCHRFVHANLKDVCSKPPRLTEAVNRTDTKSS